MADPRTLAKRVLDPEFTVAGAIVGVRPHEVAEAIEAYQSVQPLATVEPNLDGEHSTRLRSGVKIIGVKIAPTMSADQITPWLNAIVLALSDLPPKVAQAAARQAIHRPIQFLNEVEKIIREIAAEIEQRNNRALIRLRLMRAEIERAANGQPRLTKQDVPLTLEEIARLEPHMVEIGLRVGSFTQDQLDEARRLMPLDMQAKQADMDASDAGKAP